MKISNEQAWAIRHKIEQAVQSLPDAEASTVPTLFPRLKGDGSLIRGNTMIQHDGKIFRAGSDLWDTPQNTPDVALTLWKELKYRDGIRIIPATITVTEAFSEGEEGWWEDEIYISTVSGNVYTPEQYARNWSRKERPNENN